MIMITLETGYGGLQFQMIEIFIPIIEEITRAKELVVHHLGLDLNHLNIGLPRFKILKFSIFFKMIFYVFLYYFFIINESCVKFQKSLFSATV